MNAKEFINFAVLELSDDKFEELKSMILSDYLKFSFVKKVDITRLVFAEKLYDYFMMVQVKTSSDFESVLQQYCSSWDALIGKRIAREAAAKKNEPTPPIPRARKYYNRISEFRKVKSLTQRLLVDYSRISMCLYSEAVKSKEEIKDFDYSISAINLDKMLSSMKEEKSVGIAKKALFDLKELYSLDTAVFVLSIIIYYYIKSNDVQEG